MAKLVHSKDCSSVTGSIDSDMSVIIERNAHTPLPTRPSHNERIPLSFNHISDSQADLSSQSDSGEEDYPPDSIKQIEWFHPNMNRLMASAFLKTHNLEGSYLLRPSDSYPIDNIEQYTLSVWSGGGAFEFPVKYHLDTFKLEYGLHAYTMAEFKAHFKKFPRIGKPNLALILKFPLVRYIVEPPQYEVYKPEGYGRNPDTLDRFKNSIFEGQDSLSPSNNFIPINKSGFLHKRGHIRKNWKKRWFVLNKGELSYYSGTPTTPQQSHTKLIRTLDLGQVLWLDEKEHTFKQKYCFTLYFPGVKYSMYAFEEEDYNAWISIIKRALKLPRYIQSTS